MKVRELTTDQLINYLYQEADHYEGNSLSGYDIKPVPDNIRAIADRLKKLQAIGGKNDNNSN